MTVETGLKAWNQDRLHCLAALTASARAVRVARVRECGAGACKVSGMGWLQPTKITICSLHIGL